MNKNYQQLLQQGQQDYLELREIVSKHQGTFEELCEKLEGFNLEFENSKKTQGFFDINFGVINTTIYLRENVFTPSDIYEIWDDGDGFHFSTVIATVTVNENGEVEKYEKIN